jgi:hypothetical protein
MGENLGSVKILGKIIGQSILMEERQETIVDDC